jgi:predicted kinase
MEPRTKRTYNLAPATVRRVREMAERYGVAPSQDAVVELAVDELERRLREEREAAAWEEAAADADFQAEVADLDGAYRVADRETWPA